MRVDVLPDGTAVDIAVYEHGNPKGIPALFLHGGPGDCANPQTPTLFDLETYHLIMFDQRGCGNSTPRNHLQKNNTQLLIADIERIRHHVFGDQPVVLAGGSWGTALALLYAQQFPTNVSGLVLRSVFDLTPGRTEYAFYPELLHQIQKIVGSKGTLVNNIHRSLIHKKKTRKKLVRLLGDPRPLFLHSKPAKKDSYKALETMALLGAHYEKNNFFVPKNAIYKHLNKIKHIPVIIVQGRYDIVTPIAMAHKICRKLPLCDLRVVQAGHSSEEMVPELKQAYADMARIITSKAPKP